MYFAQEGQFRKTISSAPPGPRAYRRDTSAAAGAASRQRVYRLGFAVARRQARQLVRHGHVVVNGKKVNIPSFQVHAGDEVAVRERATNCHMESAKEFRQPFSPPAWLEVDRDGYKAGFLRCPKREDINLPVNEQLIVELQQVANARRVPSRAPGCVSPGTGGHSPAFFHRPSRQISRAGAFSKAPRAQHGRTETGVTNALERFSKNRNGWLPIPKRSLTSTVTSGRSVRTWFRYKPSAIALRRVLLSSIEEAPSRGED